MEVVVALCKINGKMKGCKITPELHERLRIAAWEAELPFGDLLKEAWTRFGVSEKALRKYLKEIEK